MNTSVSYRKITLAAIKEQLLGNLWSIVITLAVGPVLLLVQWVVGARMEFSINGFDILNNLIAGKFIWIAPTGFVVIVMTAFVAWIASIVNGATARTYLGAGMSRRAILTMNMKVWLASALSMTVVAAVALLTYFIAIGDFSGDVAVKLPEHLVLPFDIPGGILWWAPLATFLLMIQAHCAGYFVALVFVRLPWWIPVGVMVISSMLAPALFGFEINIFDWNNVLEFSHPMATLGAHATVNIILFGALNWLLIRRLPIRR